MMLRILGLLAGLALQAAAQAYPARPVKIVVGFPPGGSGDFLTRLIADEMSRSLGVAVVADNRPGAGGNVAATQALAKQEIKEKIALQGMDTTPSASPERFEADIRAEAPVLERLVRDSGAKVD